MEIPVKTLAHEVAHVVLGHTDGGVTVLDGEELRRDLREVEAESVALLVAGSLGLGGLEYSRGYIQHWMKVGGHEAIPEKNAQRIFIASHISIRSNIGPEILLQCPILGQAKVHQQRRTTMMRLMITGLVLVLAAGFLTACGPAMPDRTEGWDFIHGSIQKASEGRIGVTSFEVMSDGKTEQVGVGELYRFKYEAQIEFLEDAWADRRLGNPDGTPSPYRFVGRQIDITTRAASVEDPRMGHQIRLAPPIRIFSAGEEFAIRGEVTFRKLTGQEEWRSRYYSSYLVRDE